MNDSAKPTGGRKRGSGPEKQDETHSFPQHIQTPLPADYHLYGQFQPPASRLAVASQAGPASLGPPQRYASGSSGPFNHNPLPRQMPPQLPFPDHHLPGRQGYIQADTPFPQHAHTPYSPLEDLRHSSMTQAAIARRRSSVPIPNTAPDNLTQRFSNYTAKSLDPSSENTALPQRHLASPAHHFTQPFSTASTALPRGWQTWQNHLEQPSASTNHPPFHHDPLIGKRPSEDQSADEVEGSRPTTAEKAYTTGDESDIIMSVQRPNAVKVEAPDDGADLEDDANGKIDHRKRKRNRTIRSCVPCHNHKRKCDRQRPCGRCTALGLTGTCVYEIDEARDLNDPDVAETERLRRRIAELEQVVREMRQRAPPRGQPQNPTSIPQTGPATQDGSDSKKRKVIIDRYARFRVDEAKFAHVQNASDHKGGFSPSRVSQKTSDNRAPVSSPSPGGGSGSIASTHSGVEDYRAEPYDPNLLPGEEMTSDWTGRKTFLGASSGKSMLRRLKELAISKGDGELLSVPEDVAFTGVFPDMRKTFPFTTIWNHENFGSEVIGLLPNKQDSELLWKYWFDEYSVFFQPFHVPTLQADYTRFFAMSPTEKMNVPLSSLSIYLMICALGCLFRAVTAEIFGHPDREVAEKAKHGDTPARDPTDLTCSRLQSELYLSAAFQALRLCSFLANPTVPVIQCQVLIAVYLLVSERAADAWTHIGTIIKQAIALGLHTDPLSLDPNSSMREAELRRRLWWSIAGYECMLCLFFGRPSVISYYTCNMPQDLADESLSDAPGSAQMVLPRPYVLSTETTDQTYHAAYYQLSIPSFELLDRMFHVDRRFSRSTTHGWFSPLPVDHEDRLPREEATQRTYQDAVRLAEDINAWYSHLPDGMRFDPDVTAEAIMRSRSVSRVNQTLGLCMKVFTMLFVIHRPYLRLDPSAYPESTQFCKLAAHMVLRAYKSMADTRSSLGWSFWSMPYRAFQAGAVCAFLAIRQPGTELAEKCQTDLKGAIAVFEDRVGMWNKAHPVQADLCQGLIQLQKLVEAATHQQLSTGSTPAPTQPNMNVPWPQSRLFSNTPTPKTPSNMDLVLNSTNTGFGGYGASAALNTLCDSTQVPRLSNVDTNANANPESGAGNGNGMIFDSLIGVGAGQHQNTLAQNASALDPTPMATLMSNTNSNSNTNNQSSSYGASSQGFPNSEVAPLSELPPAALSNDFTAPDPLALPQFWASMFGIKLDQEPPVQAW